MDPQPDHSEATPQWNEGSPVDLSGVFGSPNLPVLAPHLLPIPARRALVANDKITLNFIHPTDSEKTLTATATGASTSQYLIEQLVKAGFITAPEQAGQYKLRDAGTGKQLLDQSTLADAGIADGTNLQVDHTVTGA